MCFRILFNYFTITAECQDNFMIQEVKTKFLVKLFYVIHCFKYENGCLDCLKLLKKFELQLNFLEKKMPENFISWKSNSIKI